MRNLLNLMELHPPVPISTDADLESFGLAYHVFVTGQKLLQPPTAATVEHDGDLPRREQGRFAGCLWIGEPRTPLRWLKINRNVDQRL